MVYTDETCVLSSKAKDRACGDGKNVGLQCECQKAFLQVSQMPFLFHVPKCIVLIF